MTGWFYLKLYLLTIPVFFAIDLLWLGVIAKDLFTENSKILVSGFFPEDYFKIMIAVCSEAITECAYRDDLRGDSTVALLA